MPYNLKVVMNSLKFVQHTFEMVNFVKIGALLQENKVVMGLRVHFSNYYQRFFIVTVQFGAFFAIVFWFFLFLYTFFCATKLELYFFEKRKDRKNSQNVYSTKYY